MDTPDTPSDLPARLAVLEEIAAATKAGLADMRAELRAQRSELLDLPLVAGNHAGRVCRAVGWSRRRDGARIRLA